MTHLNLNDHTCEGIADYERKLFSVQYHPEASPGPHDSGYLFEKFMSFMENGENSGKEDVLANSLSQS
jgi:carbamoyl-phosphate synthase small subunit